MAIRPSLISRNVALADKLTKNLQPVVEHRVWLSQRTTGEPNFGPVILRRAIVERRVQKVLTSDGQYVDSRAYIAFIGPVTVSPKDVLTLSDRTTGPILSIVGLENADTGKGYTTEVWLG